MTVQDAIRLINGNVEDYYSGTISHQVFGMRAKAIWMAVEREGRDFLDAVRDGLRA